MDNVVDLLLGHDDLLDENYYLHINLPYLSEPPPPPRQRTTLLRKIQPPILETSYPLKCIQRTAERTSTAIPFSSSNRRSRGRSFQRWAAADFDFGRPPPTLACSLGRMKNIKWLLTICTIGGRNAESSCRQGSLWQLWRSRAFRQRFLKFCEGPCVLRSVEKDDNNENFYRAYINRRPLTMIGS